jgi:hypothetical protein
VSRHTKRLGRGLKWGAVVTAIINPLSSSLHARALGHHPTVLPYKGQRSAAAKALVAAAFKE